MPSPQILPAPPSPASKLGCLGSPAGGSEGLATPFTVQGHGQGRRGIPSPLAGPGRNSLGKELLPGRGVTCPSVWSHIEGHNCPQTPTWIMSAGLEVLLTFCRPSCTWESDKSVCATGKLGEVFGVLPQCTRILIKYQEMPFCVYSFHSLLNTQPPRPLSSRLCPQSCFWQCLTLQPWS